MQSPTAGKVGSPTAARLRRGLEAPSLSVVIVTLVTTYIVVCGLTSFWLGPAGLIMCVILILLEVAVVAESVDHRHPSLPWLGLLWLATVLVAAAVGVRNFHVSYLPYLTAQSGRYYHGVDPFAKATVFADAGVIEFANNTLLDDTLSVGLRLRGLTYCAAPVLRRGMPVGPAAGSVSPSSVGGTPTAAPVVEAAPVVQFWAVGLDCCLSRGGFRCDDAGEAGVAGGIVWKKEWEEEAASRISPPLERRDGYLQAVRAASALYELPVSEAPILLRWMSHPTRALQGWLTRSLLLWILSSIAFGTAISLVCFFVDYYLRGVVDEFAGSRVPEGYKEAGQAGYGSTGQGPRLAQASAAPGDLPPTAVVVPPPPPGRNWGGAAAAWGGR